jgi:Flp pilus assembly pilin Flp
VGRNDVECSGSVAFFIGRLSPFPIVFLSGAVDSGCTIGPYEGGVEMGYLLRRLWQDEEGQDIAEYAVMLAVILVLVVGTVRLIGTQSNTVFSNVASSIQ